jgi:hypothetical protein
LLHTTDSLSLLFEIHRAAFDWAPKRILTTVRRPTNSTPSGRDSRNSLRDFL